MSNATDLQRLPSGPVASIVFALARRRKKQVLERFLSVLRPSSRSTVLDLGGPSQDEGILTQHFARIIVVNLDPEVFTRARKNFTALRSIFVVGDGCFLPLADKSVDFVFCDQVIEHVPRPLRPALVREMGRVARKGFFLSTPNLYFPFEPHYLLPLFQFIPESVKRRVVSRVRLGWMDESTYHPIQLLTARELRRLLPGANIEGMAFGPWIPETLIAWSAVQ